MFSAFGCRHSFIRVSKHGSKQLTIPYNFRPERGPVCLTKNNEMDVMKTG